MSRKREAKAWQDRPTVDLLEAAEVLGIGRTTAYRVAGTEIPVLTFGRRKVVPTTWLKKALGLEREGA